LQLLSDYYCWKDYADREGIKIDWRTRILTKIISTIVVLDLFNTTKPFYKLSKIYSSGINKSDTRLARGVIMKEASETATRPTMLPPQIDLKDKGKGIMQELEKPVKVKGKDQIEYHANVAQRIQAELDEEAMHEREREEEASKAANISE
ncbi:hypothetical protein Tco_1138821, partial [Tanacetum coccineum]